MSHNYRIQKIRNDPNYIQRINNPTTSEYCEAVKANGMLLYIVENQSREICELAVTQNPNALTFVDPKNQSVKLCEIAIKQDGMCIQYVDKKTARLCKIAVDQTSSAISFVPKKFQTQELKLIAVKNNPNILQMIDDQNEDLCLEAIKGDPRTIVHVKNQTPKIIMEALKHPNTQNFIDFSTYSIQSVLHTSTGKTYHVNGETKDNVKSTIPLGSALKSRRRHVNDNKKMKSKKTTFGENSYSTNFDFVKEKPDTQIASNDLPIKPVFVNGKVNTTAGSLQPSPKKKMIKFNDIRKNTFMFVGDEIDILTSVRNYIKRRFGLRCLKRADDFQKNSSTIDMIKNNSAFSDGAFYIKISNDHYDVYRKTTTYTNGWFSGKYTIPEVHKVREYSFIFSE